VEVDQMASQLLAPEVVVLVAYLLPTTPLLYL
jgi:hypothetical protein